MVRYRLAVSQIAVTAATRRTCRVCFSPLKTEPFHIAVRSVFRRIEAVGEKKREREGGREGERERERERVCMSDYFTVITLLSCFTNQGQINVERNVLNYSYFVLLGVR